MLSTLADKTGEPVDWWFIYKLPSDVGPKQDSTGFEYLYCDSKSKSGPKLSKITLDHHQSAVALTLGQIFSGDAETGYVLWNDEIPPTKKTPNPERNRAKGHTKGVLGFSKKTNSGFYLLHSTPRFPALGVIDLPDDERKYGQTYLCITLRDYDTVNVVAEVLRLQNEPQVYASRTPSVEATESIAKLAKEDSTPKPNNPADIEIVSKAGMHFRLMAKNRRWSEPAKGKTEGKDFWKDLVGPALKCDLNIETWRRGQVFGDTDSDAKGQSLDVLDVDLGAIGLKGYRWAYTKDHAKWGIAEANPLGYVVIADINRQVSQDKRGGGGLAFKHEGIWKALKSAEIVGKRAVKGPHDDKA